MAVKQKKKTGRPTVYHAKYAPMAAELMAMHGMIDKDMADRFQVAESTFHKWKKDHPEFKKALKKGKETPDNQAISALLKSGLGYFVIESETYYDADGNITGSVERRKWIKENSTSLIFWLKNRLPEDWKDRQEIEIDMANDPLLKFADAVLGLTDTDATKDS